MPKKFMPLCLRFVSPPEGGDPAPGAPATPPAPPAPAPKPAPPAPAPGDQGKGDEDEPLGEAGKKALDSEREARKKAEQDLAALRKEIEDGKKSVEQKAAEELETAKKSAAESAAKALKYEVAAAKGLDLKLAARLSGSTREELEADADELKALIPPAGPAAPAPDPSAGGGGGDVKPKTLTEAIGAHYT